MENKTTIEVMTTGDGRTVARRLDGLPLTPEEKRTARMMALGGDGKPVRGIVVEVVQDGEEMIRAVKLCSHLLEDYVWVIRDESFVPGDGLARYYEDELQFLRNKSTDHLRSIHLVKLEFPGCHVVQ